MQSAMLRLDRLLRRRRRARPDRLGRHRPGRGAVRRPPVRGPLQRRVRRARLAVGRGRRRARALPRRRRRRSSPPCSSPRRAPAPEQLGAAVDRVAAAAGPIDGVSLPGDARARAVAQARAGGTVVVPLRAEVDEDAATAVAVDLRDRLGVADGAQDGVTTHLVGQGALWAGMQELSKEDLAKAESAGFPVVLLILLLVFGSLAAAALPLALGFVSVLVTGGADLRPLAGDGDVGLRDQHGVDDRHRRGRRLLAVHRRPLPRGGRRPAASPTTRARVAMATSGPRRAVQRPHGDHLARRAVDGRQHGDPLDGARRDARRRASRCSPRRRCCPC